MFKKPFEEIVRADILIKIYQTQKRFSDDDFRVFPIKQNELLRAGTVYAGNYQTEDQNKIGGGKYEGDKWGGKYLRAPDIYWKILEKGKDKLVRLGDIAEVRRGFTTGVNEFFYVEDVTDKIEDN